MSDLDHLDSDIVGGKPRTDAMSSFTRKSKKETKVRRHLVLFDTGEIIEKNFMFFFVKKMSLKCFHINYFVVFWAACSMDNG